MEHDEFDMVTVEHVDRYLGMKLGKAAGYDGIEW